MDESGFTGDDLLEDGQPHFVIASTLIGEEEAEQILKRCFPRYQGPEIKFKVLWRRREVHRRGLQALAAELPMLADRIFLFIVDKRFSLLAKMFDYLVEPGFRARGYDFYADGYSMKYMNTVHRDVLAAGGAEIYGRSTALWNEFARHPSEATFADLKSYLAHAAATTIHPISTIFGMLHHGTRFFEALNPMIEDFTGTNEIQVTSILSSVTHWRQRISGDLRVIHDESTSFDSQRHLWSAIVRDDYISPLQQANGTIVQLPLRVISTAGVQSKDSPAIQLADVIAGLGAKFAVAFDPVRRDPFLLDLVERGAGPLISGGVRPHEDYANGGVPRANGPDALDVMTGLIEPFLDQNDKRRT
jgi:hypothetical protein